MTIRLYLDHNVPRSVADGLRLRGVDILRAVEDGAERFDDPALLDRATALGRALFTFDDDLLGEAATRQRAGREFAGVIYAHPLEVSIGACVRDLEILAQAAEPEELRNRIEFLPL